MASLVTDRFRVTNATNFITSIGTDNYFLFLGKTLPWADDQAPPLPLDNTTELQYDSWTNMLGAKKVTSSDVAHMIPRFDWESGTTYTEYDSAAVDLFTIPTIAPYFTLAANPSTGELYIYKCISNNGDVASTSNPAAAPDPTARDTFTTGDGYEWKFMYTLTTVDAIKFLTPQHVPVRNIADNDTQTAGGDPIYPQGGHGANNIQELGAYYVAANLRLEYGENGALTTENDFRQIGIVQNPELTSTPNAVATGTEYRQTTQLTVTAASGTFTVDEEVKGGAGTDSAFVVEHDDANNLLYVNIVSGTFSVAEGITGQTSAVTATISSIDEPGLAAGTGSVLYVENRSPISRAADQVESLTVILEF